MLRLLVLYFSPHFRQRQTLVDHLFCFRRYLPEAEVDHYHVLWDIPSQLEQYDAIILHYSLLSVRWTQDLWQGRFCKVLEKLRNYSGFKVAIPQDEYVHSRDLCQLFQEIGVNTVYTCAPSHEYQKIYPFELSGVNHIFTTLPGYVDGDVLKGLESERDRKIAIGYRARKLPYWLGRHGQLKHELGQVFQKHQTKDLVYDISTCPAGVLHGKDWLDFLLNCRTVIGCLGGASLHDPDGSIRRTVDRYVFFHPEMTFEEVEAKCFPGLDGNLQLFTLSPRHFECAMTKTCQLLVEGDYQNIFLPGRHYIEIKKDFSNIKEVLEMVRDVRYCEEIAENAYQEIALSGRYTYRAFALEVFQHIQQHCQQKGGRSISLTRIPDPIRILHYKIRYGLQYALPRKSKKALALTKAKLTGKP